MVNLGKSFKTMLRIRAEEGDAVSIDDRALWARAQAVRRFAHAPYSKFLVGVAVLDAHGGIHVGCNVENVSYPEGICAESNAIGSMVAAGGKKISRMAVAGGTADAEVCTPCGGCRQRILEFADARTRIILLGASGQLEVVTMADLLPEPFRAS